MTCSLMELLVMVHSMAQSVQPADLLGSEALGLKELPDCCMCVLVGCLHYCFVLQLQIGIDELL